MFTHLQFRFHWNISVGGHCQDYDVEDALFQESMECVRLHHRYQLSCGYVNLLKERFLVTSVTLLLSLTGLLICSTLATH